MKKHFVIATMVAATFFASCIKDTDIDTDTNVIDNPDGPQVELTLGGEDAATRVFFDNAATAEPWEKEIKTLTVYVFNQTGKLVVKRSPSEAEIAAKSVTFALPSYTARQSAYFYVVANADYGNVTTSAAMDALVESVTLDEYNGTFARTAQARKRTAGFVMTGKATATIAAAGSSTKVAVTIKRTVAKIALRVRPDAGFSTAYNGGVVTIKSVKLSRASAQSNSFYKASYAPRTTTLYEATQTPQKNGSNFDGCFYCYENGALAEGNRLLLTMTGVFYGDGSSQTTENSSNVEYTVEMTGAGGGEIKRNGYYRVEAVITGLSGDAVAATVTVADWETPVTQTVNVGQ